jgi:glycerol kinase
MSILTIDQGTSSTKAFVFRPDGGFEFMNSIVHQQFYLPQGRVEHDAEELVSNVEKLIDQALLKHPGISGIALANQGETVVAWDRRTKKPLNKAIVWQDQRTQPELDVLPPETKSLITERTGLPVDAYFAAAKLAWLYKNVPSVAVAAEAGHLGLATSDAFFIDRLTGNYATDLTTASRTSLMNLYSRCWDEKLCQIFQVPIGTLPPIKAPVSHFGFVRRSSREIPLLVSIVDQQASLFGHGCRLPGDAKVTFGTGSFAMKLCGAVPEHSNQGMIPTIAWALVDGPPVYALDGGDYTASTALEWAIRIGIAQSLNDFELSTDLSALEKGLIFIPTLSGYGAPHWNRSAAGAWIGLRQETTAEDMRRALLEGIALRAVELIESLGVPADRLISVDGGMTSNTCFLQSLADFLGRPIQVRDSATTALGAAQLCFLGTKQTIPAHTASSSIVIEPSRKSNFLLSLRPRFTQAAELIRAFSSESVNAR